jgi:hypothetical protein
MKKHEALIIISVLFLNQLMGQVYQVPRTNFLSKLIANRNQNIWISPSPESKLLPLKQNDIDYTQKIISSPKGIYILLNGTGKVFKYTGSSNQTVSFSRIDSTIFLGHNFHSIDFIYNDTIFSYGGYGFWHHNGQLRHFTEGKDQSLIKLNKEFRIINSLINYLPDQSKLYSIESSLKEESTGEMYKENSVILLDLINKTNYNIGTLNKNLHYNKQSNCINIPYLKSTLININKEIYLLNFNENIVYKAKDNKISNQLSGNICNTFAIKDVIFYSKIKNNLILDSFPISLNDFKKESYPLYEPIEKSHFNQKLVLTIIFIISALLYLFKFRKKSELKKSNDKNTDEIFFNEIERQIIKAIIEKTNKNSSLSVEEANAILGLGKKTIEVQKKLRTEAILRINQKFKIIFNIENIFIERLRQEDDRRYFRYYINSENVAIFHSKKLK